MYAVKVALAVGLSLEYGVASRFTAIPKSSLCACTFGWRAERRSRIVGVALLFLIFLTCRDNVELA